MNYILNFTFIGCAYQVEVMSELQSSDYLDPDNEPYKLRKKSYGTYTIQAGTFDGRDWYLSSNGRYAIWYWKGLWRVGTEGNKGSTKCFFYTESDDKCPYEPMYDWKYWVSSINEWVDADWDISIYVKI